MFQFRRTFWASLQRFGESMPYISAAGFLMLTLVLSVGYHVVDHDPTISR